MKKTVTKNLKKRPKKSDFSHRAPVEEKPIKVDVKLEPIYVTFIRECQRK